MSEIKLFKYGQNVEELKSSCVTLERELQTVIEHNMIKFFGVNFLASEYVIDNGRMDSIGIDENNCPVIFEYKRQTNENVINQGLFYLNWLLEHKANFKLLVIEKLGLEASENIDWSMPRVICIAGDFNKYDEEAIKQINRNVSLIRYKKFDNNLLMFELLNSNTVAPIEDYDTQKKNIKYQTTTFTDNYNKAQKKMLDIFKNLEEYALSLGDDVSKNILKLYMAFKKIKNFATMEIYQNKIILNVRLNPDNFTLNNKLRDVRKIGHWGCGDLQFIIDNENDITLAKDLIKQSYDEN